MQPAQHLVDSDEFARFAAAASEIIWRADAAGRLDFINAAWYRFIGEPPDNVRTSAGWWAHVHPDDLARLRSRWDAGLAHGASFRIEIRVRGSSGRYSWFSVSADAVRDARGEVERWYGVLIDIDDERRARESVRTLTEAFPGLAFISDPDGTLEYVNAGYLAFTGLAYDEAMNTERRMQLVHPDDLANGRLTWDATRGSGEPMELQFRFRRADGQYRWMLGRVNPVRDPDGSIVNWVGTAVDVEDLHRTSELFEALSSTAPQLVWMTGVDGVDEYWNRRLCEYAGITFDGRGSASWSQIVHPDDAARTTEAYAAALRSGDLFETQNRLRRADGVYRWFLLRAEPLCDAVGVPIRYVATATDIDDRKRTEDAMALIVDASAALANAREIEALLPEIARICIEHEFADFCTIHVVRGDTLDLAALDAADADVADFMRELLRRYPEQPQGLVGRAIENSRTLLVPKMESEMQRGGAMDPRHADLIAQVDTGSVIVAPLIISGSSIGALQLTRSRDEAPYDEADARTAEVLARRIAGAIEEARTREGERRLAETFQASALPRRLPAPGGIEIRAVYRAAEVGINVGGDWYDAFEISPWRLVLSCGDVAGKGVDAAAIMSLLRHGIRFAAYRGADPADILSAIDAALAAEYADVTATAFVAILDIRESRIRFASAGHPPAMLRLPTGAVKTLTTDPAPPLGAWPTGFRPNVASTALAYGTILALYTDGATEVERDPIAGEARLVHVLKDDAVVASTDAARYLLRGALQGKTARDDTAIVTLVFGRRRDWTFSAPDALRAQAASTAFERWLREETVGDIEAAMTIFSELVGNVVRHAPGRIEIRAERRGEDVVLHVLDEGGGFVAAPSLPDEFAEGGRGLFIIAALSRSYRVEANAQGSYVRVVLPLDPKPRGRTAG